MKKLFGTDGIRGVANQPPMTVDVLVRVGRAAAHALESRRIVLGKDTRLSCYMFETALAAGICSMGADVYLVGPMPTPGIAFLTSSMRADAGVMISASHNPYQDNGIKFFARDGFKLSDALEARVEDWVATDAIDHHLPTLEEIGRVQRVREAKGRYIVHIKSTFPQALSLEGVKMVVDCAHGATYQLAPLIFEELGAQVIAINVAPDGKNINDKCGAVHPEMMCRRVVREAADIGISFDGDGDRAIFCDEKGQLVDGDAVLAIGAVHLKKKGALNGNTLVTTVMSNWGLKCCMQKFGIEVAETAVGDRYVVEAMRAGGYNLGGEQSGHVVYLDHNTTGDGLITALQLLATMVSSMKPLSELKTLMEVYPQTLVNIPVREKRPLDKIPAVQEAIKQVESELNGNGRILVRYSGTEKLARVMVEGADEAVVRRQAESVGETIQKELGVNA